MANEISASGSLRCTNGTFTYNRSTSKTINQAASGMASGVQKVGTTHEAIGVTDLTTPGWSQFTNLDSTNYVELGVVVSATFYPFAKLLPGESWVGRLGTATPYAKANSAEVKMQYDILET